MKHIIFKNKPGAENEIDCHLGCVNWYKIDSYTDVPYIVDVVFCDNYIKGKTINRCLNYRCNQSVTKKYSTKNTK